MKRFDWLLWSLVAVIVAFFAVEGNADVYGMASVHDGDTLTIMDQHVRLAGIDAPELKQTCSTYGIVWLCGRESRKYLVSLVEGKEVTCAGNEYDRYRRLIGTCFVDGKDINEEMVSSGMALAYRQYSKAYIADENAAKFAHRGLWSSDFVNPWDWRKGKR